MFNLLLNSENPRISLGFSFFVGFAQINFAIGLKGLEIFAELVYNINI